MSGFDHNFNRILSLSKNPKGIGNFIEESRFLYYNGLNEFGSDDSDKILIAKRLLDVAVLIYVTEKVVCNNMDTTYADYGRKKASSNLDEIKEKTFCHANMRRVLESIKRYTDKGEILTLDANLVTAIRDAIMTCNYYKTITTTDIPNVFTDLANLKKDNETLFKKYVDKILEATSNPNNPGKFKIVLHSGFQKKVFGRRPGPSPNSTDQDGVFICKLRKAIVAFLKFYKIKFELTDRFEKFDEDCDNAIINATTLQDSSQSSHNPVNANTVLPEAGQQGSLMLNEPDYNEYLRLSNMATAKLSSTGGRSSRRIKAYKTIRRNNKYKNKKHYIKKRHTKRCKKSHRKSRR